MLFRAWRYTKREIQKWRTARKLAGESGYSFTADYISNQTTNWKQLLEEYRDRPDVRMLEIGSYEGRSAGWFLANVLTHPTASIVCIDLFSQPRLDLRFDHNIRISGAGNKVTKMKGRSDAIVSALPLDHFDIIYVDGSHTAPGVLIDAMLSWYALKPGGVMIFDDYLWDVAEAACDRPKMAIDLFLKSFEGSYDLLLKEYQVAVRKRANR